MASAPAKTWFLTESDSLDGSHYLILKMSPVFTGTMYTSVSNRKRKPEEQGKDGGEVDESSLAATRIVEDVKTNYWSTKANKFYCQPCSRGK